MECVGGGNRSVMPERTITVMTTNVDVKCCSSGPTKTSRGGVAKQT